jgi:hypothetical protein
MELWMELETAPPTVLPLETTSEQRWVLMLAVQLVPRTVYCWEIQLVYSLDAHWG